jgi:hypothetical protein
MSPLKYLGLARGAVAAAVERRRAERRARELAAWTDKEERDEERRARESAEIDAWVETGHQADWHGMRAIIAGLLIAGGLWVYALVQVVHQIRAMGTTGWRLWLAMAIFVMVGTPIFVGVVGLFIGLVLGWIQDTILKLARPLPPAKEN